MRDFHDYRWSRRVDWLLLACVAALCALSLPTIYSAKIGSSPAVALHYVQRQLVWLALGLGALALVNTLDHRRFTELARPFYWLAVALLGLVLLVGREINGAKAWLGVGGLGIQPSELAKLAVIVALARLFCDDDDPEFIEAPVGRSALVLALPLGLIMLEPDLGTAMAFCAVWLALLVWGGARWWQLALIVAAGAVAAALVWRLDLLADYQKARVTVLFDPTNDPRGQGYNLRQALIAIGSGGLWGQGWLHGTQTHLGFLPERHTDFIFAVFCEERGFVGAVALLGLYLVFFWRGALLVARADTQFGRTVAVGCLALLLFHVVQNIGMCVGLLPIMGLPLPFFSYGGSNLLTSLTLVGVLLNIGMRRGGIHY